MKLQLDPRIEPAIMKIIDVMKDINNRRPNDHIEHIVAKCDDTFIQLQSFLAFGGSKKFVDYVNASFEEPEPQERENPFTNEELHCKYTNAKYVDALQKAGTIFPCFVDFDFGKIMQIDEDLCVLEVLPYLLTAFYLNSNRMRGGKVRDSIADVFQCDPDINVSGCSVGGAYGRDVEDFCQLFSYQSFLPNLFNCGRTDCRTTLGHITDIESFREYIKKVSVPIPFEKDNGKKPPMRIYYSQLYKVFIYSIIASACAEEFPNNPGIDYKLSWELFSDHTDCFAAASMELARNIEYLSPPDAEFLKVLIQYRTSLQSMGVDESRIENVQKFLDITGTAMPLDEIATIVDRDEITTQELYQCYTYLFRTYFSPVIYTPFRLPYVVDNLLYRDKLAYIVMQPRKKHRKKHPKTSKSPSRKSCRADGRQKR